MIIYSQGVSRQDPWKGSREAGHYLDWRGYIPSVDRTANEILVQRKDKA